MPTLLRWNGCRFYYFSNEANEMAHVHVDRDAVSAKLWLERGTIARNDGFPPLELARVCDRLAESREDVLKASPFTKLGEGEHAPRPDYRLVEATVTGDRLSVQLSDGRRISRPLVWFSRLAQADAARLAVLEISAAGLGVHWPLIDEDLSLEGLLRGRA